MNAAKQDPGVHAASVPLTRGEAERLASILRAIGDPTRLQLLSVLLGSSVDEATVGELTEQLGVSMPTVSHHLAVLVEAGVLTRERRGRHIWYAVGADRRDDVEDLLR